MQIPFNQIYFNDTAPFEAVYKKINELVKGDKFLAEIIDIKADTVTLRLNDNSTLQAKSLVLPEARIGERVIFAVKDNSDGVIQLEFVKNQDSDIPDSFVKGVLNKLEIPVNKENSEVIRLLAENNVELSEANVDKAMFIKYSDKNISTDKLMFLLEESIPLEKNTVSVLNGILDKSLGLKNNVLELCEELVATRDTEISREIFKLLELEPSLYEEGFENSLDNNKILEENFSDKALLNFEPIKNDKLKTNQKNDEHNLKKLFNEISDKLFIKMDNKEELKKIPKKLEKLYEIAEKGKELSQNKNEVLEKAFQSIKDNMDFTREISEYKSYMQIPFSVGENSKNECELYVFKNKKGEKGIDSDNVSLLLGLDMAFLGRVEIYVRKNGKSLAFQIKADSENSLKLLKKNFSGLDKALKEKGYNISDISFKSIEEPFKVTQKLENNNNNKNVNMGKKRFSFDMRI